MKNSILKSYIKKTENIKAFISLGDSDFVNIGYFDKNSSRKNIYKEHFTLMYVINGNGTYIDKTGQSHELKPGALLLRHPGDCHSILRQENKAWLEFYIIIPNYFYEFLQRSNSLPYSDLSFISLNAQWLNTLLNLAERCLQLNLKNKQRVFPELQQFFLTVKDKQTHKRKYQSGQIEILEICRIIEESPELRASNDDLAKKAGFGNEHFRKIFREIVGCAPQEYMINCRIQKAQRMLIEDKLSLESIAFKLGYPDLPSFSRQFKKASSLSPSEFKRMINEN